jgi:group I intron endonuclease
LDSISDLAHGKRKRVSKFCTYIIKCVTSGKNYYGSTSNFKKRVTQHKYLLLRDRHHSAHLQKAWNKYGEVAFEFSILKVFECPEIMLLAEKSLLETYFKVAYNVSTEVNKAHMLGRHHSEETKQKLRKMFTGREVSEETKIKIRTARAKQIMPKGRKCTPETIAKIKAKRALQVMKSGWKMSEEAKKKMSLAKLGRKFPRNADNRTGT